LRSARTGASRAGTPVWVVVLHAVNLFLMVSIVRSGLAIRSARRPAGHWTRRGRPLLAKKKKPARITVDEWFHVSLDLVWLAVGAVYVVALFGTGRWVRLVPTSWDVLPNAASAAVQYLSLHWPHSNSWVAYNALQMLAYALVVLVLAPLAALTGLRFSALWPQAADRWFPVRWARAVHYPVTVAFVVFAVVHTGLVATTGVVRNLNHMFASRDDDSLVGVVVLTGVVLLVAAAWFATRPALLRALAALFGKVTR